MMIDNVVTTEATIRKGKTLLEKATNEIKKQPLDPNACRIYDSPLDFAMAPYVRVANFRSLVLRKEHDGWYGDIYLAEVGKGLPNIIGTPLNKPHADKRGAYLEARAMILELYQAEQSGCAPRLSSKDGRVVTAPFVIGDLMICSRF